MSDSDWLTQVFEQAQRDYDALPEWARPVLTPPVAATTADHTAPAASSDNIDITHPGDAVGS
jgi:hypothetical protein